MSVFGSDRLRRAVVVGFGATVIGRHPDRTPDDLALEALHEASARAGLVITELQGVFTGLTLLAFEPCDDAPR